MHTKWIIAVVATCLLLGFAAGSITWTPTAQGQAPAKSQTWEYAVKVFDTSADVKALEQKFNAGGDDHWEYVGVVQYDQQRRESTVVFKRVKK